MLEKIYARNIALRKLDAKTDTLNLEKHEQIHREQIFQLLAHNKAITSKDKLRAASELQHTGVKYCDGALASKSPEKFLLAYKLSSVALSLLKKENDTLTVSKWNVPRIIASNYDRYLLFTKGYQKIGTQ